MVFFCVGVTKCEGTLTKGYVGLGVELVVDAFVMNRRGLRGVRVVGG